MNYGHSYSHLIQMRNIFLRLAVIGMICSWALPDSQMGVRKRETARRYCGPFLPNILRFICNGTYHTYDWKRNGDSIQVKQPQGTAVSSERIFFCRCQKFVTFYIFSLNRSSSFIVISCCVSASVECILPAHIHSYPSLSYDVFISCSKANSPLIAT
jgi:hypothetical protein